MKGTKDTAFLAGGGEMGERIRSLDWSRTSVGPIPEWPQSLRTALSILLDSGYPMYIAWGPEFTQFYNDAYRPILGSTKHPAALGQSTTECFREIWEFIGPMFRRVMEQGKNTTLIDQLLAMDRNGYVEECYFTFSYSAIRDESGGVGGVLVTVIETTDRVFQERRQRTLKELASQAVDATHAKEVMARAAETLSQNPHDLPFSLLYLSEEREAVLAGATGPVTGSARIPFDQPDTVWPFNLATSLGRPLPIHDVATRLGEVRGQAWPEPVQSALIIPLFDTARVHIAGFLVAGLNPRHDLDYSYRNFLESVAGQIAAGVAKARAYQEEKERAEALADIDRAKTAFFSNVSHEFRTPLTLMLGPLEEVMREEALTESCRASLKVAHRNGLRLQKLVNALLDFSRIEAGRASAVYEPANLSEFTAELASNFRSACEKAGIELIIDCPPLLEPVYIDHEMWEKIVLNLLSNAFKFTLRGSIRVATCLTEEYAELAVSDTGTGIAETELPNLFKRFHRIPGARGRSVEGSGIGLALIQELAKQHGGSVQVQSEFGKGSTFTVRVPRGRAHLPKERIGAENQSISTAFRPEMFIEEAMQWIPRSPSLLARQQTSAKPGRVLVADDNADMRDYLVSILSTRFEVAAVSDGAQALQAVQDNLPDLVLTDVMMPVLDGVQLLSRLRADPRTSTIPVILLSARAGEEARIEGLGLGADDYLTKPFTARELLARVTAHVEMAQLRRDSLEVVSRSEAELKEHQILLAKKVSEFEILFRELPVGVGVSDDSDCRHIRVNPALAKMLGTKPGDNASATRQDGQSLPFRVLKDGREIAPDELPMQVAAREAREVRDFEFDIVRDDGVTLREFGHAVPLWREDGTVGGSIGVFLDITERTRAAEAIRFRTAQFETLLNQAPMGVYLVDADFRLREVNPAARPVFSAIPDVIGRDFDEVIRILWPPGFAGEIVRMFRHTLETGEPFFAAEWSEERRDIGVTEYYEWRLSRILLPDGRYGVVCYFRDISAQVHAREHIANSEQRFRSLVSVLTDVPWTSDAQGRFVQPQHAWAAYTGQISEESSGFGWLNAIHPEDRENVRSMWSEACSAHHPSYRARGRLWHHATQEFRTCEARAIPLRAADGSVREWVGTCTDIEDQRRAEEKLLHANAELEHFAYAAAHDLQEPLRQVSIYSELLQRSYSGKLDAQGQTLLNFCRDGARRMERLIADLLTYARLTSPSSEPPRLMDLNQVLKASLGNLHMMIEEQRASVTHDELPVLAVDSIRVQQIFQNLVSNALKYRKNDEAPRVHISAVRRENEWVVAVRDNGIGIPPAYHQTIFGIFKRLQNDRSGTGLGLAMCHKIVERHGGRIWVESEPGKGSTFFFTFPLELEQSQPS